MGVTILAKATTRMTMRDPTALVDELIRTELVSFGRWSFAEMNPNRDFVLNPYYAALCHALWRVMLGHQPELRILCASYAADLAEGFQIQTRRLMDTERYRRLFPKTRFSRQQATKDRFLTTCNGERLATSVGGKVTGFGGDIIILDDIMRAADARSEAERQRILDWFTSSLPSRFDNPKAGKLIVVQQRLNNDDLPAHLIAQGGWTHLDLPAIEWRDQKILISDGRVWHRKPGDLLTPERLGLEELARLRREMGTADFEAQYNQRPAAPEGRLIKLEWFPYYRMRKWRREAFEAVIQSWDTALVTDAKADYTACVTLGLRGRKIYVLDVFRDRLMFTEQRDAILAQKKKYDADLVVIEKSGSGHMLWEEINLKMRQRWLINNDVGAPKTARAEQQTAKLEARLVLLPVEADWLETFKKELAEFPRGKHDDLVDAFTQGLRILDYRRPEIVKTSYYRGHD